MIKRRNLTDDVLDCIMKAGGWVACAEVSRRISPLIAPEHACRRYELAGAKGVSLEVKIARGKRLIIRKIIDTLISRGRCQGRGTGPTKMVKARTQLKIYRPQKRAS